MTPCGALALPASAPHPRKYRKHTPMAHTSRPPASERIPGSPLDEGGIHSHPPMNALRPGVTRHVPGAEPASGPLRLRPAPQYTPWPVVLLSGPSGSGKTHNLAAFSSDRRIAGAFLVEWGEADADIYVASGAPQLHVIDHDGSWPDILGQIAAASAASRSSLDEYGMPYALFIDSISSPWTQVMAWAHDRPRRSMRGQAVLASDPDSALEPGFSGWQEANDRHAELMDAVMSFPGPVVLSARGREAIDVDQSSGTPTGRMIYKTEGHKGLEHLASVVVRLRNGAPALVVKCVAPGAGLNPGEEGPVEARGFSVSWLLDELERGAPDGFGPRRSTRLYRDPTPGDLARLAHLREMYTVDGFDVVSADEDAFRVRCTELTSEEEGGRLYEAMQSAYDAGVRFPDGVGGMIRDRMRQLREERAPKSRSRAPSQRKTTTKTPRKTATRKSPAKRPATAKTSGSAPAKETAE